MAKIMVVDDSRMIRNALKLFIESANHEVVFEAQNGKLAVDYYDIYKPDVVTMDINMPIMDGIEAVKQIKAKDSNARIIMMSALNQKDMVLGAIQNGATNYILKPVKKEAILNAISKILS